MASRFDQWSVIAFLQPIVRQRAGIGTEKAQLARLAEDALSSQRIVKSSFTRRRGRRACQDGRGADRSKNVRISFEIFDPFEYNPAPNEVMPIQVNVH
jgi:hypothetical protein